METDHIELVVSDRSAALPWYEKWLGYRPLSEFAEWAEGGPLMLSNDDGKTMLALFEGGADASSRSGGWRRLALRASAEEFLEFGHRFRASGQSINGPVDHGKSWSWYFDDPSGNAWEVTTYGYDEVAAKRLASD